MNLSMRMKNRCFIIIILIIVLIILMMFHNLIKSNIDDKDDCNCSISTKINDIPKESAPSKIETMGNKNILCLYYVDWCGHSRNFLPIWDKIKQEVNSSTLSNDVQCEQFNCEKDGDKDKCSKHMVSAFPTILLHKKNGQIVPYEKARDLNNIISFIKSEIAK